MGGFASTLATAAKGILGSPAVKDEGIGLLKNNFSTLEKGFERTDAGKFLGGVIKDQYIPFFHQYHQSITTAEAAKPFAQQRDAGELYSEARNAARQHAFGQNDGLAVAALSAVHKQPGLNALQQQAEKQILADHVHMFLRDTAESKNQAPYSVFKKRANLNKDNPAGINVAAKYTPPTPLEQHMVSLTSKVMLPAIAIPHLGTAFNLALDSPISALAKGVADIIGNRSGTMKNFADTGIFNGTSTDAYSVRLAGSKGMVAQATNPAFGAAVASVLHAPGFKWVRETQIALGASVGYHTLQQAASDLVNSGGKDLVAAAKIKRMRLDPNDVLKQNGALSPDQIKSAVFNSVDRNIFLDNSMSRSFSSNANVYHRLGLLYHGYITRQAQLMKDTLINGILKRELGAGQAAQAFGTLAVLFPTVGVGLKTLEMYGRGQFQNATPLEDYKKLYGQEGAKAMLSEMFDGYAHMGAFGVLTDYMRSATRFELAKAMMGPIGNEAINLVQDTATPAYYASQGKSANFKPLGRDLLYDTMPLNIGKAMAHQLLPTKKEQESSHPSKLKKLKMKGLSKLRRVQ